MRKMSLIQLSKNIVAFAGVSFATSASGLFFLQRIGWLDVPGAWYVNAALGSWTLLGIPVSLNLAERVVRQIAPRSARIVGFTEGGLSPATRRIPLNANGKSGSLMAYGAAHIFGRRLSEAEPDAHRYLAAVWHVPVDGNTVKVRESELRAFLEVCWKRHKYQFSRNYWTRRRKPPLYRQKYEAYMRLLVESGLVEGRHELGGASGYLILFPREAMMYLKYESPHRV